MLSAFAVTNDLSTCTRCGGMRSVGLDEFRDRVRGRPFRFLLRYHLRRHDAERIQQGLEGSLAVLSPAGRRLAVEMAETWADELRGGDLADVDCSDLLDRVRDRARASGDATSDAAGSQLFDLFEAATLSLVLEIRDDEELREAVGGTGPGWTGRRGWNLAAAALLAGVAVAVEGPVGGMAAWTAVGLVVLPPVARLVGGRR